MIRRPSGAQIGNASNPGSDVSRVIAPPATSTSQMSWFWVPGSARSTAMRFPSGEIVSVRYKPACPAVPTALPRRSNQVRRPSTPPRGPVFGSCAPARRSPRPIAPSNSPKDARRLMEEPRVPRRTSTKQSGLTLASRNDRILRFGLRETRCRGRHGMRWENWSRLPAIGMVCGLAAGTAMASDAPLADAAMHADKTAIALLLADRAGINTPQPDGTTALHWAIRHDDLATADALIRAGADTKAATRYGVTPIALAATNGDAAMIRKLLDA